MRLDDEVRRIVRLLPWWAGLVVGIACIAVGVALTLRPFTSLGVLVVFVAVGFAATGVSELVSASHAAGSVLSVAVGLGWLAAGVLVVAWAGITIHALAIVVGVSMVVGGLTRLVGAIRGRADDRLIAALTAVASVVFGVLALAWVDVTVLVLALLVGARTVLFGFGQVAAALGQRFTDDHRQWRRSSWPRWLRIVGAAGALALALGLVAISAAIHRSSASLDAFYTASRKLPSRPGVLLRTAPFTRGIPPNWRAWRILYTTTRDENVPAVASGVVIVSKRLPAGPRPVIAWAHGTTGVASACAPSLLTSRWNSDVIPGLDRVIARGWIFVASDYVGLGTSGPHPYLIGQGEARSVLDSVRAARQLPQLSLQNRVVVWGHSQGGHAALWTGTVAPRYAPDVNIVGIAALAPASDLRALVDKVRDTLEGKIIAAYILTAYSEIYPDVSFNRYVRPAARVIVRQAARRCLEIPEAIVSGATKLLARQPIYQGDPLAGALGERLAQNTPTGPIRVPVLIAQGLSDPLVPASMQERFVKQRCATGQRLQYRTYQDRDHLSILAESSPLVPDLLAWTVARFAGRRPPGGCTKVSR